MTSQSIIGLNASHLQDCKVEIRDVFGYLIREDKISKDEVIGIKRRHFKAGIYFISLFEKDKLINKQKLLLI